MAWSPQLQHLMLSRAMRFFVLLGFIAHRADALVQRLFPDGVPDGARNLAVRCTLDVVNTSVVASNVECPAACPYSLMVIGDECEKICVEGSMCHHFNPIRVFPDNRTMSCAPACGADTTQHVAGCAECAAPGVCKKCSRGLFGLSSLELSEDGSRCINLAQSWWWVGYGVGLSVLAALGLYMLQLSCRKTDEEAEAKLRLALEGRERLRMQLVQGPVESEGGLFSSNVRHLARTHGGKGVYLYFNWLMFSILVALLLATTAWFAWEFSDLARHTQRSAADMEEACGHKSAALTQFSGRASGRAGLVHASLAPDGKSFSVEAAMDMASAAWKQWAKKVLDLAGATAIVADRDDGTQKKYDHFYRRMFKAACITYCSVTVLAWAFAAWQLRSSSQQFDQKGSTKEFVAVVSGLPRDLVDGRFLTRQIEHTLQEMSQNGSAWQQLWDEHSKEYSTSGGGATAADDADEPDWANIPLADRFKVIGSSIAYDYYERQDEVDNEIYQWLNGDPHAEGSPIVGGRSPMRVRTPMAPVASDDQTPMSNPLDQWTLGAPRDTQLTLEPVQLRSEIPKDHHFFESFLEKIVGLEHGWQFMIYNSGSAFVTFSTQVARDAVIHHARQGKLTMPWGAARRRSFVGNAGRSPVCHLSAAPAPCEAISVQWGNFAPNLHFVKKIVLGVLLLLLTMMLWLVLYIPYAAFYADLVFIPGFEPSMIQDMILGLLIAIGNMVLALVIDKVTTWAGFRYKQNRDVAVLYLAFLATLLNTVFDLAMIAVVAKGVMLEDIFNGSSSGYDTTAAKELFGLIFPGYLLLPYIGGPIVEHCVPFFLAYVLVRAHGTVTLRSAVRAVKCPDFDICWRYADVLNNTTICTVMLFFASGHGWKIMMMLLFFIVMIFYIDKKLLMRFSSQTVYDTQHLSNMFARLWCVPTALLAGVAAFWAYKVQLLPSVFFCFLPPALHLLVYLTGMAIVEHRFGHQTCRLRWYPTVVRQLRAAGRRWDFFNTNPVYCLRSRRLGAEVSGWAAVYDFVEDRGGEPATPSLATAAAVEEGAIEVSRDECVPFVPGQVRLPKVEEVLTADKL